MRRGTTRPSPLSRPLKLSGDATHKGILGRAYALAGRRTEARRILAELLQLNQHTYVGPMQMAMIYAALGEKDQALDWLDEADRVRDGNMILLKVWSPWDPLRQTLRFQDLLRRMKFP